MDTPLIARITVLTLLMGSAFLALANDPAPAVASAAVPTLGADVRLSGVVTVGGEARLAVVEYAGQGGRLVRVGDTLPERVRITAVGADWILLSRDGQERRVYLSGLAPAETPVRGPVAASGEAGGAPAPAAPQPIIGPPWMGPPSPEVVDAVRKAVADPLAGEADLAFVLVPLLNLAPDAHVKPHFPGEPEREARGVAEVRDTMSRGEVVRLVIESGGEVGEIYISQPPPQSERAAVQP